MWRYIIVAVGIAVLASEIPGMIGIDETSPDQPRANTELASIQTSESPAKAHNPLEGRMVRIPMDSRGHFVTNARMNGRKTKVLVDTGATSVAINETTARRLGIRLKKSDFRYTVNTANGSIKAAIATIDEIQIGRVRVRNVQASVVGDKSLSSTLLGMSFLKELHKFEISDKKLILTQ